jgi:putative membrane protein
MRYRFDSEGISMRWGILFRREVLLNYARIQDIHLVSNFVERWLGLARIQIQTASGSATPEMTLEGLLQFEGVRDFLYARMRGSLANRKQAAPPPLPRIGDALEGGTRSGEARRMTGMSVDEGGELAETLRSIAMDMRAIREALEKRGGQ